MCNDDSSSSSPVADDASKSLNSFVMDRMRHKALQKWQTNSSRTLNTQQSASKEVENECRVIAFDANADKDCDMSSCGDDATTTLGMEDFSGRRDSFFDDWLDVDEPVVDIPRPAPLKNKAKTTGRSVSPVPRPSSKTHLRRVKSDERFAKPHNASKNKMRKVVSDADKARFKMPNSSVLDDDAWCGGPSIRDLSKLCGNKESTRVTGLPTASRSLSPPKSKETDKEEGTNKLRRAVSDLGKKAPASPRCSATSSTGSTSKADRRRLIKDSVSNLAGTKSSDASDAIRTPCISDIRSMIHSCHGDDPQRTTRSSSSTRKKKTLARCRSENESPRDALASKSCHSRLASSSSNKSRSQSPQSKNKDKLSSSSCHNRLTTTSKSKSSRSKSSTRSSTPPPDFRWDHYKVNSQAA